MKLTFLGTKGLIDPETRLHNMHASLLVSYYNTYVMIDCGESWRDMVYDIPADTIVLTHAHPDHAFGLKDGAPCPVYTTQDTCDSEYLQDFDIKIGKIITEREPFRIGDITFEAFPVLHSTRAPAVGYRITAGDVKIFYVPDVAYIPDRSQAFADISVYIGDGSTVKTSFIRKPGDVIIGHIPVQTQLTWCQKENVPKMIITHCGEEIVTSDERTLGAEIRDMAAERGVEVEIAHDGMEKVLR